MPIYGYRCDECGHELEVFQSMSDAPLKVCPVCGAGLRKMLYPVGVQFKGSGFYTTDYKNGSRSDGADKSGDGSASSGEKSESKPSGDSSASSNSGSGDKPAAGKSDATATKGSD
jgi:putative FmdB family regulatory protein